MDVKLPRKSVSFLLQSGLCRYIVVIFRQGEKSGFRLVTFHLCIKDQRPESEAECRSRSQADSSVHTNVSGLSTASSQCMLGGKQLFQRASAAEKRVCQRHRPLQNAHPHAHSYPVLDKCGSVILILLYEQTIYIHSADYSLLIMICLIFHIKSSVTKLFNLKAP